MSDKTSTSVAARTSVALELFILGCIYILAFMVRLFSVLRFESVIHEFDPWFNFRVTKYLVSEGFYNFHNWFDETTWYPLGRYIGGTLYPGLMWTAAMIFHLANWLHFTVNIRNVCVLLAPFMASNTSLAVYLLTKEAWNNAAGIVAAMFMSLVPAYISRSVAGSYDNEAVAIFALTITFYLWCKSVNTGSIFWSCLCSIGYFYMVAAWGGYIFIINLIPVHVLALLVAGRYTHRLYVAYCIFYVLGTIMSMNIQFVQFIPVSSPEHMPSFAIFGLLQLYSAFYYVKSQVPQEHVKPLVVAFLLLIAGLIVLVIFLSIAGYIPFLTGRLLSLLGSTKNIAIVKSVSEHQPSPWTTFFFDFNCIVIFIPVGLFYCFAKLNDTTLFLALYVCFSSYFSSIMVRLVLVLSSGACAVAAIGVSETLFTYMAVLAPVGAGSSKLAEEETQAEVEPASETQGDSETAPETAEPEPEPAADNSVRQRKGAKKDAKESKEKAPRKEATDSKAGGADLTKKIGKRSKPEVKSSSDTTSNWYSLIDYRNPQRMAATGVSPIVALVVIGGVLFILCMYVIACTWVTSIAYSSPSVVLQARNSDGSRTVFDDFREAYYWLAQNTADDAKIMSWWDYGYQIKGMGNRSVIVDNNTRNNSHIALVGLAMSSTEEMAYPIMRALDVDYVLVVFGGVIGYSSDDINKFLWMVRISGGIYPRIVESDFYSSDGQYRVDYAASKTMRNCMMYKMSYYRFGEMQTQYGQPTGYDRVRQSEIAEKNIKLTHLEEAFTSEHWMVRIFRVKKEIENVGGIYFPKVQGSKKFTKKGSRGSDKKKSK